MIDTTRILEKWRSRIEKLREQRPHYAEVEIWDALEGEIAQRGAIVQAARRLVSKLAEIDVSPEYQAVWKLSALHFGEYKGPNYVEELAAVRALLESPDSVI